MIKKQELADRSVHGRYLSGSTLDKNKIAGVSVFEKEKSTPKRPYGYYSKLDNFSRKILNNVDEVGTLFA